MNRRIRDIPFYFICLVLIAAILCQIGVLPFRITYFYTGSMAPTYQPGDLAVIYTGVIDDLGPGDVILYRLNGEPVIHRIKSIEGGQITTQGDANNAADLKKITHVDGKLLFSIPKLGYLIDYFHIMFRFIGNLISPG